MPLILDTGPIVALLDRRDAAHQACVGVIADTVEDLVVPAPVLVEVDYWARKRLGLMAWRAFIEDLSIGAYRLENLTGDELMRASELESQYSKLGLGFVDASVVVLCERFEERRVVTLDRRDLGVVRPRHCERLHLLPE